MKKLTFVLMFVLAAVSTACSDDDNDKVVVAESVKSYIAANYPGAVIKDADYERGYLEVDIYHDSRMKELYFNSEDVWVATTWDVSIADLPTTVTAAIASVYPDYRIDDADYVITSTKEYYYLDLEKGNFEESVSILSDGTILSDE